jgi:hypothetical protein
MHIAGQRFCREEGGEEEGVGFIRLAQVWRRKAGSR